MLSARGAMARQESMAKFSVIRGAARFRSTAKAIMAVKRMSLFSKAAQPGQVNQPLLAKTDDGEAEEKELSSNKATMFNIVNIYVGLGLLSAPFAMSQCGFTGASILIACGLLCCYTGHTIVKAFNRAGEHPESGGESSYLWVGFCAYGKLGEYLVNSFVFLEFFGALAMCLVYVWSNIQDLAPHVERRWIVLLSTCFLLPSVWIKRFSKLSFISLLGFAGSCTITIIVVVVLFVERQEAEHHHHAILTNPAGIGEALGIFLTSFGGQACLPVLYHQMKNQGDYAKVLNTSFVLMFIVQLSMALAGYLRYGDATSVLVTHNLQKAPGGWINDAATTLIITSCACTVAPIAAMLSDFIAALFPAIAKNDFSLLSSRTAVMAAGVTLGYAAYDSLGNLQSLIGGVGSMFTSLILPAAFFLKLFYSDLKVWEKGLNLFIIVMGLAMSVYIVFSNIKQLLK